MTQTNKTAEAKVAEVQKAAEAVVADTAANVREMTEQGIERARSAYDQFKGSAQEAVDVLDGSASVLKTGAADFNARTIEFTQANINAGFDFALKAAAVKDVKELFELQTAFAQSQMQTCAKQIQDLGELSAKVAEDTSRPFADGMKKSFDQTRDVFSAA